MLLLQYIAKDGIISFHSHTFYTILYYMILYILNNIFYEKSVFFNTLPVIHYEI